MNVITVDWHARRVVREPTETTSAMSSRVAELGTLAQMLTEQRHHSLHSLVT